MALRNLVIRGTLFEMQDDETLEIWLKRGTDPWELYDTVAVELSSPQDFELDGLEEGVLHEMQIRAMREGRYRAGYLSSNPDTWPEVSHLSFEPGTAQAAEPTVDSATWSRTAADAQRITCSVTPSGSHLSLTLQLLRNGTVVDEIAGPHVGAVSMVDLNPPLAEEHTYTARHVASGPVYGDQSAPVLCWAGITDIPTGLAETFVGFYLYSLSWDAPPSGMTTRISDDYLCAGTFANRALAAADATSDGPFILEKESAMASNGNVPADFQARARHESTSFGVVDVSDWCTPIAISAEMASDETAFNSCP
jgi:hypothetical protein